MAYTFTETNNFALDSTFDSLYSDSVEDIDSGTVALSENTTDNEKKQRIIALMNNGYNHQTNVVVSRNDVTCMYIQGHVKNNTYVWNNGLTGKINNSKSWCSESQLWTDNKTWTQSKQCDSFEIICIADSRIETFLTGINTAGRMQGTLSKTTNGAGLRVMRWEF